jgi:hypothetical protein
VVKRRVFLSVTTMIAVRNVACLRCNRRAVVTLAIGAPPTLCVRHASGAIAEPIPAGYVEIVADPATGLPSAKASTRAECDAFMAQVATYLSEAS